MGVSNVVRIKAIGTSDAVSAAKAHEHLSTFLQSKKKGFFLMSQCGETSLEDEAADDPTVENEEEINASLEILCQSLLTSINCTPTPSISQQKRKKEANESDKKEKKDEKKRKKEKKAKKKKSKKSEELNKQD